LLSSQPLNKNQVQVNLAPDFCWVGYFPLVELNDCRKELTTSWVDCWRWTVSPIRLAAVI